MLYDFEDGFIEWKKRSWEGDENWGNGGEFWWVECFFILDCFEYSLSFFMWDVIYLDENSLELCFFGVCILYFVNVKVVGVVFIYEKGFGDFMLDFVLV